MKTEHGNDSNNELLFIQEDGIEGSFAMREPDLTPVKAKPNNTVRVESRIVHENTSGSNDHASAQLIGASNGTPRTSGATGMLDAESLGVRLKEARKRRGMAVGDVAQVLNLHTTVIRNIEAGDLKRLPDSYEVGFCRTYAQYIGDQALGISVCSALEGIRQEFGPKQSFNMEYTLGEELGSASRGWIGKAAIGTFLVIGAVAWFVWSQGHALQSSVLTEDDVPNRYTMNLQSGR